MCGFAGIITVKRSDGQTTDAGQGLVQLFGKIRENAMKALLAGSVPLKHYLDGRGYLEEMEKDILHLKGERNFQHLFFRADRARQLSDLSEKIGLFLFEEEKLLEENADRFLTEEMETINSRLVLMKDIHWSFKRDILDNIERIIALTGADGVKEISPEAFKKYRKINFLLNCLERLEVRGRDSAGIQISFTLRDGAVLDEVTTTLKEKGLYEDFLKRTKTGDLVSGCISLSTELQSIKNHRGTTVSFTYKTSLIIGELGRNIRDLKETIARDRILQEFARQDAVFETSFAHTRWASVGAITEENCHPVNNFTLGKTPNDDIKAGIIKNYPRYGMGNWTISVVLNGDIDNYQALRDTLESEGVMFPPEVTTDTKIIPLQIEKYLSKGCDLTEAFRLAVNDFEGSHAIAMVSNVEAGKVFLALMGSGQSIYVGLTPDQYIFSSELYGLVEGTPFFLKMDGDKSSGDGEKTAGQIFVLDQDSEGGLSGIRALNYDGTPLNLQPEDIRKAEITTRDIYRGDYPHYFLKEITESSVSVKKTLRGKYRISEGQKGGKAVIFNLGQDVVPEKLRDALLRDEIRNITVIGHGTAAVAGAAIAEAFVRYLKDTRIRIEVRIASELSGFFLRDDMRDTLVIPVTQSGTTTDTNRAVTMAVERGATIIAIVNRRQSEVTTRADGVFYTSDGRDIEMSVASTKAFYSQIVAGHVLALFFAQLFQTISDDTIAGELLCLEQAPEMMRRVLEKKEHIGQSARHLARQKRYWAVVGSGPNKIAADEIRIKLSELCYTTISSDVVENKKHIDLSAEPLIIVCAAGSEETVIGDIIKDVAIFKAHRASVIVFADEGEDRFNGIADAVIGIPKAPLPMPLILNTLTGHLWGYYAARSIDEDAVFFREFRSHLNQGMFEHEKKNYSLYERIADRSFRGIVGDFSVRFNQMRSNDSFSQTGVKTTSDIALLLKYAGGKLPLEDFWHDFKGKNGITSPIDMLDIALGHAVDELSRPIDAIRHQAKTVTVGTSRREQPLRGIIFNLLRELRFSPKAIVSKDILAISRMQPAMAAIKGYTLYDINNLDMEGNPGDASTISIKERGGISVRMKSRAEDSGVLMGTKKTIVSTGRVYVGRGKSDGAPIVIIPLLGETYTVRNLLLIHVDFNESLTTQERKDILGYRFNDIRNLINEYNFPWDDRYLERIPMATLLGEPVEVVAEEIKQSLRGQRTEDRGQGTEISRGGVFLL
ncbi:MAG: SIS domain-containing protein [Syntrophales bacterium]|nr:SIS domain-containing protein [Syntrophales bacterium]